MLACVGLSVCWSSTQGLVDGLQMAGEVKHACPVDACCTGQSYMPIISQHLQTLSQIVQAGVRAG